MPGLMSISPSRRLLQRAHLRPLAASACAAVAVGACGVARADDPNPYYIGISQALTHDSNINRIAGGPADSYSSTGLIGGVDQSIGRQRVYGSGNVTLNRFSDQTALDNTSYGLNAALDWQTIGRLSGTVFGRLSQGLASQTNSLLQATASNNQLRTQQLGARASLGVNSQFSLQGGYGRNRSSYSTPSYQASDSIDQSSDIGVYYQPGQKLTLSAALRYTESTSGQALLLTDGSLLDNRTNGRNIDLGIRWQPTVRSGAYARLSFTRQSNDNVGNSSFSGLTGALGFNYAPTGKLTFGGSLSRDAATNSNFYYTTLNGPTGQPVTTPAGQQVLGLAANSTISNNATFTANYSATAKVGVNAGIQYTRNRQDQNDNRIAPYNDRLYSGSLGATWAIRRFWSAGCTASYGKRDLAGSFNTNYTYTTYGCSTQLTLQ